MFDIKSKFIFGKNNFRAAQNSACKEFTLDADEEECITTIQTPSCYNCSYRRWTAWSFVCTKWLDYTLKY